MLRKITRQFINDLIDSLNDAEWELGDTCITSPGCPSGAGARYYPSLYSKQPGSQQNLVIIMNDRRVEVYVSSAKIWLPLLQRWRLRRAVRACMIRRAHELVPINSEM